MKVHVAPQVMIQAENQVLVKLLPWYVTVWENDFFFLNGVLTNVPNISAVPGNRQIGFCIWMWCLESQVITCSLCFHPASLSLSLSLSFFFFFFASLRACGSSQARDWTCAIAVTWGAAMTAWVHLRRTLHSAFPICSEESLSGPSAHSPFCVLSWNYVRSIGFLYMVALF